MVVVDADPSNPAAAARRRFARSPPSESDEHPPSTRQLASAPRESASSALAVARGRARPRAVHTVPAARSTRTRPCTRNDAIEHGIPCLSPVQLRRIRGRSPRASAPPRRFGSTGAVGDVSGPPPRRASIARHSRAHVHRGPVACVHTARSSSESSRNSSTPRRSGDDLLEIRRAPGAVSSAAAR